MAAPSGAGAAAPAPPSHVPPPVAVPDAVMRAIYGERAPGEKKAALEDSLRKCVPRVQRARAGLCRALRACGSHALRRSWWTAYAERKDDEDECAPKGGSTALLACVLTRRRSILVARRYVADTLLYDKTHLPRTAPAPECVRRDRDKAAEQPQPPPQQQQQQTPPS